ncbi:hypothetical protein P154DRAFT_455345, partial [Amniculicola lignicola CBS 123094]
MSTARSFSQLLASRCIHLRIQPRPANLSESREVLRVLKRFGEISTYKSLRYEYHNPANNVALAIFREAEAAQKALDASPIRFSLETRVEDAEAAVEDPFADGHPAQMDPDDMTSMSPPTDGIDDILRPSTLIGRTFPPSPSPKAPSPAPLPYAPTSPHLIPTSKKWFHVTIDRSQAVHQDFVERQPFWKEYSPMKNMVQEDLANVVPLLGLSDVAKRPLFQHRTRNRVLKRMAERAGREGVSVR